VSGKLTGVDIGEVIRGTINTEIEIETVEVSGEVRGIHFNKFGARDFDDPDRKNVASREYDDPDRKIH
jgi:hypothetical protein